MSTAFLYARLYGDRDTDLDGQYMMIITIHLHEATESDREAWVTSGRDNLEAEEGSLWFEDLHGRWKGTIHLPKCNGK